MQDVDETRSAVDTHELSHRIRLRHPKADDFVKLTYLRPGQVVSCSMLRPPSQQSVVNRDQDHLPVLVNLHGAGLEVDANDLLHSLDQIASLPCW